MSQFIKKLKTFLRFPYIKINNRLDAIEQELKEVKHILAHKQSDYIEEEIKKLNNIHLEILNISGNLFRYHNCPICGFRGVFKGFNGRKYVICPQCSSFERHRFFYLIYKKYIKKENDIVYFAPEKCIAHYLFNNYKGVVYCDLFPEKYQFCNTIKQDIIHTSFNDNSFDFFLANHILEHISDEAQFFKEVKRILKPNGKAFLSFPIDYSLDETFEDDTITDSKERLLIYGQADHVRKYGKDALDRFKSKFNIDLVEIKAIDILSEAEINERNCGINTIMYILNT